MNGQNASPVAFVWTGRCKRVVWFLATLGLLRLQPSLASLLPQCPLSLFYTLPPLSLMEEFEAAVSLWSRNHLLLLNWPRSICRKKSTLIIHHKIWELTAEPVAIGHSNEGPRFGSLLLCPTVNPKLFLLSQGGGKTVKTGWFHAFFLTLFGFHNFPCGPFGVCGIPHELAFLAGLAVRVGSEKGPQAQWSVHPWIHFCHRSIANFTFACRST